MAPKHKPSITDPPNPPTSTDHLSALPPELQHTIISHLLPNHHPNLAFHAQPSTPKPHPIAFLAATSHILRASTNAWAHSFLKQHAAITNYRAPQPKRNYLTARGGLLRFITRHCVFCGKPSKRRAILANGLKCCASCDRSEWSEKITKTAARKDFDLKDAHLLPRPDMRYGIVKAEGEQEGVKLPRLRYGSYMVSGVATTMFLRAEVRDLAEAVHGDFEAHVKARGEAKAERVRRKRVREERAVVEGAGRTVDGDYVDVGQG